MEHSEALRNNICGMLYKEPTRLFPCLHDMDNDYGC